MNFSLHSTRLPQRPVSHSTSKVCLPPHLPITIWTIFFSQGPTRGGRNFDFFTFWPHFGWLSGGNRIKSTHFWTKSWARTHPWLLIEKQDRWLPDESVGVFLKPNFGPNLSFFRFEGPSWHHCKKVVHFFQKFCCCKDYGTALWKKKFSNHTSCMPREAKFLPNRPFSSKYVLKKAGLTTWMLLRSTFFWKFGKALGNLINM